MIFRIQAEGCLIFGIDGATCEFPIDGIPKEQLEVVARNISILLEEVEKLVRQRTLRLASELLRNTP